MLRKLFSMSGSAGLAAPLGQGNLRTSVWSKLMLTYDTPRMRNNSLVRYFSSAEAMELFPKGRKFAEFDGISATALEVFRKKGIEYSFPVQDATWLKVRSGDSLIVREKTGAGKTLGYVLPALEKLRGLAAEQTHKGRKTPKVLVLVPTRELCIQVTNQFSQMFSHNSEFHICSLYGGAPIGPQLGMLERGVDILVATPGRLEDVMNREVLDTASIDMVVLDETDQMLDIGFADKITEIVNEIKSSRKGTPEPLQCLLFSATVPKWVQEAM